MADGLHIICFYNYNNETDEVISPKKLYYQFSIVDYGKSSDRYSLQVEAVLYVAAERVDMCL